MVGWVARDAGKRERRRASGPPANPDRDTWRARRRAPTRNSTPLGVLVTGVNASARLLFRARRCRNPRDRSPRPRASGRWIRAGGQQTGAHAAPRPRRAKQQLADATRRCCARVVGTVLPDRHEVSRSTTRSTATRFAGRMVCKHEHGGGNRSQPTGPHNRPNPSARIGGKEPRLGSAQSPTENPAADCRSRRLEIQSSSHERPKAVRSGGSAFVKQPSQTYGPYWSV